MVIVVSARAEAQLQDYLQHQATAISLITESSHFQGSLHDAAIPALESAHALGFLIDHPELFTDATCELVTISGRGDKDLATIANHHFTEGEIRRWRQRALLFYIMLVALVLPAYSKPYLTISPAKWWTFANTLQ